MTKILTRSNKTRKNIPWKLVKTKTNNTSTKFNLRNCGNKCFLGPNKSFPICKKNTCKVSKKGLFRVYSRQRIFNN